MGRGTKSFIPFLTVIALLISLVTVASGVTVKPGKFDHFGVAVPQQIAAGQDTEVKLQAMDAYNNIISSFSETGKDFTATVSGSATVTPGSFSSASFKNGIFSLRISDRTAGSISLTIVEKGSAIPVVMKELAVAPAALKSFEVVGPKMAVAGDKFYVQIKAKDAFGNTVPEQMNSANLTLSLKAREVHKGETVSIEELSPGVALATLMTEEVGKISVVTKDSRSGISGTSKEIAIVNGAVYSFRINAPEEVMQGEPFGVTFEALDRFSNPVIDYTATGKGVDITSSGKTKTIHESIAAHAFTDGRATVMLTYEGPDKSLTLYAAEAGRRKKSKSVSISVTTPAPTKIEVVTPDTAVAGEKFKIQVTVYNQNGNVFRNFSSLERDVALSTTGSGRLLPSRIKSSDFVNGTAVVEVRYNRPENFTITATTPGMKRPPAPVAAAPAKPEKPVPVAKVMPKPEIKKEVKKEEPKQPEKAVEEKKAPAPAPVVPAPPAKVVTPAEKPKPVMAKEEPKRVASKRLKPVEVASLSLIETEEKTLILIHAPNLSAVGSGAETSVETAGDKIILRITPGTNKMEKMPQFDSAYVKKISVEDDRKEKGTTLVSVELTKPVQYQLKEGKSSIVLTLTH